jgi:hypothetical protein
MMSWFEHCQTLDEARNEYRRLCFEHHPDHGGDTLVMQAINAAYAQFRGERIRARRAHTTSRPPQSGPRWQRPQRERPSDIPPQSSGPIPAPEPQPLHSRDAIRRLWFTESWQPLANGNLGRCLAGHTVLLVRHPAPKYQGAWFVLLDNSFSPYFYHTQSEAEQAAFDLLYDKVKYHEL